MMHRLKTNKDMTRRSALRVSSMGGLAVVGGSISSNAVAEEAFFQETYARPLALRSSSVTVAAVQMNTLNSTETGNEKSLHQMMAAIQNVKAQADTIDLISFHDTAFDHIRVAGPEMTTLTNCAKQFGCYLSFGALSLSDSEIDRASAIAILINPDGCVSTADRSTPSIHATDIGTLALVSGPQSSEAIRALSGAGAEIIIRCVQAGYPRWDMQASSAYNVMYSIVVARVDLTAGTNGSATAIFGPYGNVMTESSARWEQTVIATLRMAAYRANRKTIVADQI